VAVRELDGTALLRGIVTGYEVQVDIVRAISLHGHEIDHVAHLGPSVAAGLGSMLGLPTEVVHQAIGQALHTTTATRQSRKGAISTWKAHARRSRRRWPSRPWTARCGADEPGPGLRGGGRGHRLAPGRAGRAVRGPAARTR